MLKVVSTARRAVAVRYIGCGIKWRLIVIDRKVPDEEEKKNPTKMKSSSGCHTLSWSTHTHYKDSLIWLWPRCKFHGESVRILTAMVTEVINGNEEDHLNQKFQIQGYQNKDGLPSCRKFLLQRKPKLGGTKLPPGPHVAPGPRIGHSSIALDRRNTVTFQKCNVVLHGFVLVGAVKFTSSNIFVYFL